MNNRDGGQRDQLNADFCRAGLNRESLFKALAGEGNPRFSTVSGDIKTFFFGGGRLAVA
ncbi:MAG: hypothetical protein WGN25_09185 [Candidatus Electrothrix sp. GW3-4]|uniref:helix-turn-helix domain-containing transcriptional regulator n=1 Tax=Candidatus Electrothrix sp. GW3-4 TaxID=3126740 RepID=UPI0030CD3C74